MQSLNQSNIMNINFEKAYAKINLNLYIINERKDNYHNLYSDIIFVNIYDTITIKPKSTKNNKIDLIINGTFKNTLNIDIKENIVYKAARYFMQKYKIDNDLVIILNKSLPIASGLGGGSADAAATLRKLTEVFHVSKKIFNNVFLKKISKKLGADIPTCIFSSPQTMRGIGEKIYSLPINLKKILRNNHYIILINPNVCISTELVFSQLKRTPPLTNIVSSNRYYPRIGINNLKSVAENIEPSIILIQKLLSSYSGIKFFGMSGSGATCFGIFNSKSNAIKAQYRIKKIRPKWWIKFSSIKI